MELQTIISLSQILQRIYDQTVMVIENMTTIWS